jgi:hypothetical protein
MWIVAGIGTLAAAIGLLVGIVAEWGAISGALANGWSFDRWLAIEVGIVAVMVLVLIAATRKAWDR